MQLAALVQSADHVCCRYRLAAFRPFLEDAGHQLELLPLPRSPWSRFGVARSLHHYDAVIVQRKLFHPWQLWILRRRCRRLIFDFDDAVYLRDSYSAKGVDCPRRLRDFGAMVDAADTVVAGNEFLRTQAIAFTDAENIAVIPTCVEPAGYPLARHLRPGEGVQLVWIGSSSTLKGLEAIQPMLEDLGRRCPGLRLKMVCDRFPRLEHLPVLACPWAEATEATALAEADIGISWIPDDDWSRGKCGLKVLQYLAAGLPVIANPVGVHTSMVRHGVNGFLARTPEDWHTAVQVLASDPELRRRMGQAGRQLVENEYSVASGARKWVALLREITCRVHLAAPLAGRGLSARSSLPAPRERGA